MLVVYHDILKLLFLKAGQGRNLLRKLCSIWRPLANSANDYEYIDNRLSVGTSEGEGYGGPLALIDRGYRLEVANRTYISLDAS